MNGSPGGGGSGYIRPPLATPGSFAMCSFATVALLLALVANIGMAAGGWFDGPPSPLYPSSGKRHHLPYHPVARFRGADTRPYYPYEVNLFPDYIPAPSITQGAQNGVPEGPMNAGELLALLFSGIRQGEPSSKMRGTLRFGIARR